MSVIKLSKSAYEANLDTIILKAGGTGRVICVLKDNAYSHGATLLAPLVAKKGIDFVAVKNETEAKELEGLFKQILILSHRPNGAENPKFIYALNDISHINLLKKGSGIHIKIDSGMHRNGICLDELKICLEKIKTAGLKLKGAFTHFAEADELSASFFVQKTKFKEAKELILANLSQEEAYNLCFHSHNSSALFRSHALPKNELCRVGLTQFGYNDDLSNLPLKKVLKLYAHKLSSRILKPSECLGYGLKFSPKESVKIATYDLGYADGLFRFNGMGDLRLANGGKFLGKISMDSFSCKDYEDELCVMDDANVWAKFFNTISYEILVKLSPNIKRVLDV